MKREELKDLIKGTIVTTPTPFDNEGRLDLARTADVTQWWIEQGLGTNVAPLKVAAAGGEGPDMTDDEWQHLLRTTVNSAGSGAVVMCGLKAKSTMHTIEDAKMAHDLGAIGLQIDLPFFHHPNQDDYVRFYSDISDAIDIGIMIYNTHWFCSVPQDEYMKADSMMRLKDSEHVVAIKWSVPEGEDYDDMRKFSDTFNVIDNSGRSNVARCFNNGGIGYISNVIAAYPAHDLEVFEMLKKGQIDEAQAELDRVNHAFAPWMEKTTARSGGYRQGKGMSAALGRPVGPPRPPTIELDDQELAEIKVILDRLGWK